MHLAPDQMPLFHTAREQLQREMSNPDGTLQKGEVGFQEVSCRVVTSGHGITFACSVQQS